MKRSRYTEEQIAFALHQAESGTPVAEVIRKMGITEPTFYRWKKQFAGIKGIDASRGVTFDNALVAYQAAMDGLGVALGRNPLVAPDLTAGRLVVPFDFKMSSEFAYYAVYPAEAIRRRKIKAFRDWLITLAEVTTAETAKAA